MVTGHHVSMTTIKLDFRMTSQPAFECLRRNEVKDEVEQRVNITLIPSYGGIVAAVTVGN
jgi:hypothetical protein